MLLSRTRFVAASPCRVVLQGFGYDWSLTRKCHSKSSEKSSSPSFEEHQSFPYADTFATDPNSVWETFEPFFAEAESLWQNEGSTIGNSSNDESVSNESHLSNDDFQKELNEDDSNFAVDHDVWSGGRPYSNRWGGHPKRPFKRPSYSSMNTIRRRNVDVPRERQWHQALNQPPSDSGVHDYLSRPYANRWSEDPERPFKRTSYSLMNDVKLTNIDVLSQRQWQNAVNQPPLDYERFTILSYNILADYLAKEHYERLYGHIPFDVISWDSRKWQLLSEMGFWSSDIICLQEVDKFQELEGELNQRGYSGMYKKRTGTFSDGCAIFWRNDRFRLLYDEAIEYNVHGFKDNVAQIAVLEVKNKDIPTHVDVHPENSAANTTRNPLVVCNVHLYFNPKRGEIKLGQVRVLLECAKAVSKKWYHAPILIAGDFNSCPKSPLYNFLLEGKLDVSAYARSAISGQKNCQQRTNIGRSDLSELAKFTRDMLRNLAIENKSMNLNPQNLERTRKQPINMPQRSSESSSYYSKDGSMPQCPSDVKTSMEQRPILSNITKRIIGQNSDVMNDRDKGRVCCSENSPEANLNEASLLKNCVGDESTVKESLMMEVRNEVTTSTEYPPNDHSSSNVMLESNQTLPVEEETGMGTRPVEMLNMEDGFPSAMKSRRDVADVQDSNLQEPMSCQQSGNKSFDKDLLQRSSSHTSTKGDDLNCERSLSLCSDYDTCNGSSTFNSTENNISEFGSGTQRDNAYQERSTEATCFTASISQSPSHSSSSWTAEEVEAATGNSENPLLQHDIKLKSAYTEVKDHAKTKDSYGEPAATCYNRNFIGTVDYVWHTEDLQIVKVLDTLPIDMLRQSGGLPTKNCGSDHLALVCEFTFSAK